MTIARATAALCMLGACAALPARAAISIAGGGFIQDRPSQSGVAAVLSSGTSLPKLPVQAQASLLVPLAGRGGYALTGEIKGLTGGGFGGAYIGAGAGFGSLSVDGSTGPVVAVFAGKSIARLTAVELRFYKGTREGGSSAGFIGVRFSL